VAIEKFNVGLEPFTIIFEKPFHEFYLEGSFSGSTVKLLRRIHTKR
jgi:hypothetical protein